MFEQKGPKFAVQTIQYFLEDYGSKLKPALKLKLREALDEAASPRKLRNGLEVLYVIATEAPLKTDAGKAATLNALGIAATMVEEAQYGGPEVRDRASAIVVWAAHQLEPVGKEPPAPDVDSAYTTILPEPVVLPTPELTTRLPVAEETSGLDPETNPSVMMEPAPVDPAA